MLNIIINIITSSAIYALNYSLAIWEFAWIIISLFRNLNCKKPICLKLLGIFRTGANVTWFSAGDDINKFSARANVTRFSARADVAMVSVGAPATSCLC